MHVRSQGVLNRGVVAMEIHKIVRERKVRKKDLRGIKPCGMLRFKGQKEKETENRFKEE